MGGIGLLLGAMRAHPKNGELQERACGALLSLSAQASILVWFRFSVLQMRRILYGHIVSEGFRVQPKFAASKGACLAAVMAALRNHPKRPLLMEQGTKLVTFLYGIDVDWVVRTTFFYPFMLIILI